MAFASLRSSLFLFAFALFAAESAAQTPTPGILERELYETEAGPIGTVPRECETLWDESFYGLGFGFLSLVLFAEIADDDTIFLGPWLIIGPFVAGPSIGLAVDALHCERPPPEDDRPSNRSRPGEPGIRSTEDA